MAKTTNDPTSLSPFSRIRVITAKAANRGNHAEHGRLHEVEVLLGELKHRITTVEALATGEALEILREVKRSIFGDGAESKSQ
jgi:hypothetical protein